VTKPFKSVIYNPAEEINIMKEILQKKRKTIRKKDKKGNKMNE